MPPMRHLDWPGCDELGTSARAVLRETLAALDVHERLASGGLERAQVEALLTRFVEDRSPAEIS